MPTPVGEVQTKRMIQRQTSTSSHGSATGSVRRPGGPQRQNSSGSMTERTFREPSPNRSSSPRMMDDDAPPMPPIPRAYASPPPVPVKSARRPASVEPPERIGSPPPRISGGRGVSLDRGPGGVSGQTGKLRLRKSSLNSFPEHERDDLRASVNFSRPMGPQNTPPTSPMRETRPQFPQAASNKNTISTLPESEREEIQFNIQETASIPVKKKKRTVAPQGSHLANGGLGGKPFGSALETTTHQRTHSTSSTPSLIDPGAEPISMVDPNITVARKKKKKRPTPDERRIESPPNNYASDSDVSERSASSDRPRAFNTRAAGLLTKQPSVVREDREAEELEERGVFLNKSTARSVQNGSGVQPSTPRVSHESSEGTVADPLPQQQVPSIKTASSTPPSGSTLSSKPALSKDEDSSLVAKRNSLSPLRAAHFSSVPMYETPDDVRHQPPPRSISPAKSAMKQSQSSRGASPAGLVPGGWRSAPGLAPSEASDTTSVVSDEGYRSQPKKKKNFRVSFDDDPTIVGRPASPPTSPESPMIASPQNRHNPTKGWFGLGRGGKKTQIGRDIEPDDTMRPTPVLPSFGSVRVRPDESDLSGPHPHSVPDQAPNHIGASNDHLIGTILAQNTASTNHLATAESSGDSSNKKQSPVEAAGVEEIGYHSDSGSNNNYEMGVNTQGDMHGPSPAVSVKEGQYQQLSSPDPVTPEHEHNNSVPSIAIQPATPGIEESSRNSVERWLGMPGGFPPSTEFLDQNLPESYSIVQHHATDPTPSALGISEPLSDMPANSSSSSPMAGDVANKLRQQTNIHEDKESESTDDSIYSDAAEDLSDVEGDGFGSINAIVESPTLAVSTVASTKPADITNVEQPIETESLEPQSEEGWGKAQAYWSGLSQSRKEQLEQDASLESVDITRPAGATPKPKRKKKSVLKQDPKFRENPAPVTKSQVRQEGTQKTASAQSMRKSMRGPPQSAVEPSHMRSSMRSETMPKPRVRETASRDPVVSSSFPEPRGSLPKKPRPTSAAAMVDYNKAKQNGTANRNRNSTSGLPSQSLTPIPAQNGKKQTRSMNPSLRRNASDGSNSSSSFRKARPSTSDNGRYNMRRSMRSSSIDERPRSVHIPQSSAFSLRSNSPTGSTTRRPFSSAGPSMRTSLRGSLDADSTQPSKSPTRSLGFGRGAKSKAVPTKSKSRFSSRFGDSSDEDGGPTSYNSRFADSSDDDETPKLSTNLTPVRGIPKRIDEGDSTDLEDSSEEAVPEAAPTKITPSKSSKAEGAALASGSLRHNGSGLDLSRTTDNSNGFQANKLAEKEKKKRSFFGGLGRRKDDMRVNKADVESAARRDTPLERSKEERVMTPTLPAAQSPKAPKLQRRTTPKRFQSDTWPLPQSPATTHTDSRPTTSDGASPAMNGRPALGTRRSTLQENGAVLGKSGKKKRFPMLRKAFGLHD